VELVDTLDLKSSGL